MIYIEQDSHDELSLYLVKEVGDSFIGWRDDYQWTGVEYELYDISNFVQVCLAPTVLDRWSDD